MRIALMVGFLIMFLVNLHTIYLGLDLYQKTHAGKALVLSGMGLVLSGFCASLFFRVYKNRRI